MHEPRVRFSLCSPARSRVLGHVRAARTACLLIACASACVEHLDPAPDAGSSSSTEGTADAGSEAPGSATLPDEASATGIPGSDPGDGNDENESSDSAGMPACMGECAEIPLGWSGPVVLAEAATGEPALACTGAFGSHAFTRFADLWAPDAECGCTCGEAVGTTCPDASLIQTSANCLVSEDAAILLEEGCNDVPNVAGEDWRVPVPVPQGGACAGHATTEAPPVEFGSHVVACGPTGAEAEAEVGAEAGCGADETCVPAPDDGAPWCVWAEGEQACPDGFPARRLAFGDEVDDTRGCTECSCGAPEGECDMSAVVLNGLNNACGVIQGAPLLVLDAGECGHFGGNLLSVDVFAAPEPDVACTPSTVQATGSVSATDTVTVCCSA